MMRRLGWVVPLAVSVQILSASGPQNPPGAGQQGVQNRPSIFDEGQQGDRERQPENGLIEVLHLEARVLCPVVLRVPSDAASRKPPLLVFLHGRGSTIYGVAPLWDALNEPKPVFVVPEAPYSIVSGTEKKPALGGSWDFPSRDRRMWDRADPLVWQYVLDTIRAVRSRYQCSGVYVMGHSQGVAYAYRAALADPGLVDGVIAMAGMLHEKILPDEVFPRAAPKVRIFIAHGVRDQAVPLSESRHAKEFLESKGFNVTYREFDGGHEVNLNVVRDAQKWMTK